MNYAIRILREDLNRKVLAEYPDTEAIQDLEEAISILAEILSVNM